MKILITGGTGFIGARLALLARSRGFDIRVTGQVNTPSEAFRKDSLERAGVVVESGDLRNSAIAKRLLEGREAVIHLAAAQHEANVPDSYFRELNVDATRKLLEASRDSGVRRFVYGSSIGVYGADNGNALDETSSPDPVNIYGQTKLEAEGVVHQFSDALETTIVRISETYGPGDMRLLKLFRAIDRGVFMMIGAGQNLRQLIHVDDLGRGLLSAMESPNARGETFILAGNETLTTNAMVEQVATALDRPSPRFHLPLWPFMATAIALEHTLKPLGIQPPLHRRRLDFFTKSFLFSTKKASTMLKHAPQISFRQGAAECARWYRENGMLSRDNAMTTAVRHRES